MEPKIIRSEEMLNTERGKIFFNSNEWPFVNISKIKIEEDVTPEYNLKTTSFYYVLDGEGDCIINNNKYHLKKGDFVFYPQGTKYQHLKGLTLLAISMNPFIQPN